VTRYAYHLLLHNAPSRIIKAYGMKFNETHVIFYGADGSFQEAFIASWVWHIEKKVDTL
jgi:hypothetical protein